MAFDGIFLKRIYVESNLSWNQKFMKKILVPHGGDKLDKHGKFFFFKANFFSLGTDVGVSAAGNVISLYVRSRLNFGLGIENSEDKSFNIENEMPYTKMLNAVLPKDISNYLL
jgi:hypothetical protein